jgi:hypothetical protein
MVSSRHFRCRSGTLVGYVGSGWRCLGWRGCRCGDDSRTRLRRAEKQSRSRIFLVAGPCRPFLGCVRGHVGQSLSDGCHGTVRFSVGKSLGALREVKTSQVKSSLPSLSRRPCRLHPRNASLQSFLLIYEISHLSAPQRRSFRPVPRMVPSFKRGSFKPFVHPFRAGCDVRVLVSTRRVAERRYLESCSELL